MLALNDDVIEHPEYRVAPARYAKGQMAVKCRSNGTGMKTRAMRLCCALKGRYTNRSNAYIMSPTKARRFVELHSAGWDACFFSCELTPPPDSD